MGNNIKLIEITITVTCPEGTEFKDSEVGDVADALDTAVHKAVDSVAIPDDWEAEIEYTWGD